MKATVLVVEGYWTNSRERFEERCVVMPKGASDSKRDEILKDVGDVFYVFNEGDQILGAHTQFVVVFYHPVRTIDFGEVQ